MSKKALITLAVIGLLIAAGFLLYASNGAPPGSLLTSEHLAQPKPYVVKLHAKWCPVCMLTKKVWSEIDATYRDRAHRARRSI